MEQRKNNKRKKAIIIAALIAIPGFLIAGVFASNTTISLNNDTPLSLGAGYTTATTCDNAVDVSASQEYSGNAFQVNEIRVSKIDQVGSKCGNKTLTLVVVKPGGTVTSTFSIASTSADTNTYILGQSTGTSGNNVFGSSTLTPFALDQLSTIAIGIS
jgi:hypothetical protein